MDDITVRELKGRIKNDNAPVLVDVRELREHEEFNIGGKNCPLGDIHGWMNDLEDQKDVEIVLYCSSGNRSGMAKQFLAAHGFTAVRNLVGGMEEWRE